MQLPQQLSSFWQRLTRTQRLSFVSILFFLAILPVGIWLALSPTSPFSRASDQLATPPVIGPPPPPPPAPGFPTGTIEGPTSGTSGEKIGPFTANGKGPNLQWVRIYWAKGTANYSDTSSWTLLAGNDKCNGESSCAVTGYFAPPEAGTYSIVVNANSDENGQGQPCSGNPVLFRVTDPATSPIPGWVDCGSNSRIKVTVNAPIKAEQSFLLQKGYNFTGVTFYKSGYTAEEFLKDLNTSFTIPDRGGLPPVNPVKYIFWYDASERGWHTHKLGSTTDNFPIKPWVGYLVYSSQFGSSKISLKPTPFELNLTLNTGWSLISTPIAPPSPHNSARTLLELAQTQRIDITSIWRWDPVQKKYEGYRKDTGGTDFTIVTGEAYWIYNNGSAGSLVYPLPSPTPTPVSSIIPSPFPTGIPLPPLPQ